MRRSILLPLGVLMIGIGIYIAVYPLVRPGPPLTTARWLDLAFAFFFIVRGWMNVSIARRLRARPPNTPNTPPTAPPSA